MKKIYLTFDIEPIVSGLSFNPLILNHVLLSSISIAEELKIRGLKGTFYVSLSRKTPTLSNSEYKDIIKRTIELLRNYPNIDIQPHLHCYDLPVSFETQRDEFGSYGAHEQVELLGWSKRYFHDLDLEVRSFRPGSYSINENYYKALSQSGIKFSSVMNKESHTINFGKGTVKEVLPFVHNSGVKEYPVTSVLIDSIKGKKEVINLSPDFLTIDSVQHYLKMLNYININFHSFSMYSSRLARENHAKQLFHNIKYLTLYKPLQFLARKMNSELLEKKTLYSSELLRWLDYVSKNNYETYFIGD